MKRNVESIMESENILNSPESVDLAYQALIDWARPSRVGVAYKRFLQGIQRQPDNPVVPVLGGWEKPYKDLLKDVNDIVIHPPKHGTYLSERADVASLAVLLDTLYGPANDWHLKEDHRYNLEWTYRDSTEIAGSDFASKATGKLHVINVLTPLPPPVLGHFTSGTAHAGVGFLFRPLHTLTKLKMTPMVSYRYHYLIHHDSPETISVAITRGFLRLVVFRVNLFTKASELTAEWPKKLWDVQNQPVVSRHEDQQSGTFHGFPVQLDFTASSDFVYAVCCVATVYVSRGFYAHIPVQPPQPTLCTGNLECDVSAMWLEQEKLA